MVWPWLLSAYNLARALPTDTLEVIYGLTSELPAMRTITSSPIFSRDFAEDFGSTCACEHFFSCLILDQTPHADLRGEFGPGPHWNVGDSRQCRCKIFFLGEPVSIVHNASKEIRLMRQTSRERVGLFRRQLYSFTRCG